MYKIDQMPLKCPLHDPTKFTQIAIFGLNSIPSGNPVFSVTAEDMIAAPPLPTYAHTNMYICTCVHTKNAKTRVPTYVEHVECTYIHCT
jgi:hypothetical protein